MDGKSPRYVPERIVDGLKMREDEDGFVKLDEVEGLRKGQQVRIGAGLFEGQVGIYEGMTADERAIVLFKLLGGDRKVPVNTKILVAI